MADAKNFDQLLNNLFGATDKIIAQRMKNLEYDKTIIATIEDASNRDKGEYLVTDGSSRFKAFSENTKYNNGNTVYVSIPNGDFRANKRIVGKYVENNSEYYTYTPPLDTYVDITGNLIGSNKEELVEEAGLLANGNYREKILWYRDNISTMGYDRMGLSCEFKSLIAPLKTVSGNYGLRLDVISRESNSTQEADTYKYYNFYLDVRDMCGDPYNFVTYYPQQVVFDISDITEITAMQLIFYQENNFKDNKKQRITSVDGSGSPLPHNLFVKEPYISFGYDLNGFDNDKVILYSFNESTYAGHLTDETKEKLWGEKPNPTEAEITEELNKLNTKKIELRWVHKDGDKIKAVKELDLDPQNTVIHWYHYKLQNDIVDELAGPFWEEVQNSKIQINDKKSLTQEEMASLFTYTFVPDYTNAQELIKVIIESPSKDYIENVSMVNDNDFYALKLRVDRNDKSLTEAEIKEYERKRDSKYAEIKYYYSDLLTFVNEDLVPDKSTVDLISGLKIECDKNSSNGVFRLYDTDGKILSNADASRKRLLTATYSSLITGKENLDTAESITWYIPIVNTMIQEPLDGIDYNIKITQVIDGKSVEIEQATAIELQPEDKRYRSGYKCIYRENINPLEVYEIETDDQGNKKYTPNGEPIYKKDPDTGERIKLIGAEQPAESEQLFRIKPYYTQSASNNTVYCVIRKNSRDYEASFTMNFGVYGTSGTDFTLSLSFENGKNYLTNKAEDSIVVIPRVYDYENNEIPITDDLRVSYSWWAASQFTRTNADGEEEKYNLISLEPLENGKCKLTVTEDFNTLVPIYILTCSISGIAQRGTTNIILRESLPIPIGFKEDLTYIGPDRIAYDEMGKNPAYYKGDCKLLQYNNGVTIDYPSEKVWQVIISGYTKEADAFYPSFKHSKTNNSDENDGSIQLTVPSMYLTNNERCIAIVCYTQANKEILWIQPLYIYQHVYNSGLLNSWDGNLTIDENNGTILSVMVGAGYKDNNNRFNGVLMGKINNVFDSNNKTGLFGFHEGAESFGFNIDGTAFLGKSGRGRILLNGNKSTITSYNFFAGKEGLQLDLDSSPYIVAKTYYEKTDENGMVESKYPTVFQIGGVRTEANGEIRRDDDGNPLYDDSFLQTADYDKGKKTGAQIMLSSNGKSSFDIKAYSESGGVKVSSTSPYLSAMVRNDSENSENDIDDDGNKFFTVFEIGNDRSFIRTNNYKEGVSGVEINLKTSIFTLSGYNDSKSVVLTNQSGKNPLHIKNGSSYETYLSWNGEIFAGNADIKNPGIYNRHGTWFYYGNNVVNINNGTIYGGSIKVGKSSDADIGWNFTADDEEVTIGDFRMSFQNGTRSSFYHGNWSSSDVGLSGNPPEGRYYLWAGSWDGKHSNLDVSKDGVYVRKVMDSDNWKTYTLGKALDYIWADSTYGLEALYKSINIDLSWFDSLKVENLVDIHSQVCKHENYPIA